MYTYIIYYIYYIYIYIYMRALSSTNGLLNLTFHDHILPGMVRDTLCEGNDPETLRFWVHGFLFGNRPSVPWRAMDELWWLETMAFHEDNGRMFSAGWFYFFIFGNTLTICAKLLGRNFESATANIFQISSINCVSWQNYARWNLYIWQRHCQRGTDPTWRLLGRHWLGLVV